MIRIANYEVDVSIPLKLFTIGSHEQEEFHRPHGFSAHQIFICSEGEGTFQVINNEPIVMSTGQAVYIPENRAYNCCPRNNEPWKLSLISFHASSPLLQSLRLIESSPLNLTGPNELHNRIDELWNLKLNTVDAAVASSIMLYTFLLQFKKFASPSENDSIQSSSATDEIVANVSTFINEHYHMELQINELASMFGYSLQHLNRLFKARYGVTAHQYLLNTRLSQAEKLLLDYPELNLQHIAARVGMEANYFMRMFRKKYSLTPRIYMMRKIKRKR
jgi:AraC family transcriptional regulator